MVFTSGHPSRYRAGSMFLNFGNLMGTFFFQNYSKPTYSLDVNLSRIKSELTKVTDIIEF